jgi:putative MATE family efflux protein
MERDEKNITKDKNISILIGDPKKAIIYLSIPMIIANIIQTLYNLVDAIWVAGLGGDALASIGVFFPFYMAIISIGVGLSSGISSSIGRFIGKNDFKSVKKVINQSIVLTILLSIFTLFILLFSIKFIFIKIGLKEKLLDYSLTYSYPLIINVIFILLTSSIYGILRGLGNSKGTMFGILFGAILNILLDPVFIYILNLKVFGAALATVISQIFSFIIVLSILQNRKNIFRFDLNLLLKKSKNSFYKNKFFEKEILNDILKVAIPSTFAQLSMSIAMFFINYFVLKVAYNNGLAVFTSSWRIIMFAIVPLTGLAASSNVVVASNYGKRDYKGLKEAYLFSIFFGFFIELFVYLLINVFSLQISSVFNYNNTNKELMPMVSKSLKYLSLFIPFVSFGMNSSSFFQGIGDGKKALIITIIRTIIFQIAFSYIFGILLKFGLKGIFLGISFANISGSFIGFSIGIRKLSKFKLDFKLNQTL